MNNETVHEFKIKYRGDNCYDVYVDGKFVSTKGSIESAVKEIEDVMLVTRQND